MGSTKQCRVCMTKYSAEGGICPICRYNEPYALDGRTDNEELLDDIKNAKAELLHSLSFELKTYTYEIENARIDNGTEEFSDFGQITDFNKLHWISDKFETVNTRESLKAQLKVTFIQQVFVLDVSFQNIKNAQYLLIGISVDSDFNLSVTIKDQTNKTVTSGKVYIFTNRS